MPVLPAVLRALPFGVAVVQAPAGRVLVANEAWRCLLAVAGLPRSASLGEIFPKAAEAAGGALQGAGAAASVAFRALPLGAPGGVAAWCDLDIVPHPERAEALLVTLRDVTEEVLARRDAAPPPAPDDAALRRAMRAAGVATFEVEEPGAGVEALVSPDFRALFGLPEGARCDVAAILARIHPDDRPAVRADHARLAAQGGRFAAEFRVVRPDGSVRWIASHGEAEPGPDGAPRRLRGVMLDITARRMAEETLAEREAQLRRAQQIGRVGGFEIDLRSGVNRRSAEYMRLQGHSAAPAREAHEDWVRRLHPEDREAAERRFLAAVADEAGDTTYAQDYRIVTPEGEVRWIAARAEIERDPHTGRTLRVVGAHLDVTDLKAAEAAVRESEARLQQALRAGRVLAFEWDVVTDGVRRSGDAAALLGLPAERVERDSGTAYFADVHPEDRPRLQAMIAERGPADPSFSLRYRFRRPDGRVVWLEEAAAVRFDAAGRMRAVSGLSRDVTAEVEAQEARAASEARLRLFIERAPAAIAMFDGGMRFLAASRRFLRDFGLDEAAGPDALAGRLHYDVFPGFPQHLRAVHRRVLDGETLTSEEDVVLDPSGRPTYARWEMAPWHRADGSIGGALFFSEVTTARKEAERALRASEARFRALVEASGPIIFQARPDGAITSAPGWTALTGQPEAELRGDGWLDRLHPEDRPCAAAAWRAALRAGTPARVSYRVRTPAAEWRWLEAYAVPVRDAAGGIVEWVGTLVDIHDRRLAEEAAQRSAGLLRTVIESTPDLVWAKDSEGRLTLCNRATLALFADGDPARVIGRDAAALVPDPEQARAIAANDARIVATGRVEAVEEAFRDRLFQTVKAPWRDGQGRVVGIVGVSRDVTDERVAEAARLAGEARLKAALHGARLGIWERHLPSATGSWDARAAEIYGGLTVERAGGSLEAWRARVHPEDRARRDAMVARAAAPGGPDTYSVEFRFRRDDGGWNWVCAHGTVVERDPATGRGVRLAGVVEDRTAMRLDAERLRLSEERLRLAQEAGGVGSWEWDPRAGELHWSESCYRLHGLDPAIPVTFAAWHAGIHPEDAPAVDAAVRNALDGRADGWEVEFRFTRPSDGAERWIAGRARIERDAATGAVGRVFGVGLDVTARRQAEERLVLLAREVDHRAKNALAVVQAAVRLAPKHDAAAFARAVEGRVAALARAQVLLAGAGWRGAPLRTVAEGALAAFLPAGEPGEAPRASLEGPDLQLAAAATQPVSLALHELATNAAKYGALSQPGGRVALSWALDRGAGLLRLRWEEAGGPPVVAPSRRGFGSRVIAATLGDQLGGTVAQAWDPGGLRCDVALPLGRAVEEPGPPG